VALTIQGPWVAGFLINNIRDIDADQNINLLTFQLSLGKALSRAISIAGGGLEWEFAKDIVLAAASLVIRTNELLQPKPVTVHRTMVNPEDLKSLVYNTIENIDLVHGVKPDAFP